MPKSNLFSLVDGFFYSRKSAHGMFLSRTRSRQLGVSGHEVHAGGGTRCGASPFASAELGGRGDVVIFRMIIADKAPISESTRIAGPKRSL